MNGCRIGFDLGGSDRKVTAVIDGKVVFSEETVWDPYFHPDPQYHFDGIMDSLKKAAAQQPQAAGAGKISDVNTMPYILECVRAYATVGEICDALREVYGTYEEVSVP